MASEVPVADTRSRAKRVAIAASAAIVLAVGAIALYVLVNADEAKSVQTTAEAGRICKRALAAGAGVTCSRLIEEGPQDPWGRDYLCEITKDKHVRITSLGRDGRAGGQEADADVTCEPSMIGDQVHCGCRIITD